MYDVPFSSGAESPNVDTSTKEVGRIASSGLHMVALRKGQDIRSILQRLFQMLGRYREHVRPDRNDYVAINWDSIQPGKIVINHSSMTQIFCV